jgi:predicted SAM-dependent methyltransferase
MRRMLAPVIRRAVAWLVRNQFHSTVDAARHDVQRLQARRRTQRMLDAMARSGEVPTRLHLGAGRRRVAGWLNVDLAGSDVDVDLASGRLPFGDGAFEVVASQHVIEHLRLVEELEPLMVEIHRVTRPGASIWLSCPDIWRICTSYLSSGCEDLVEDRRSRVSKYSLRGYPASQFMNDVFHQGGEHKNLFDLELVSELLRRSGFTDIREVEEHEFLAAFPEFPERRDGKQTIYVRAQR